MDPFLAWLEQTALSVWVRESTSLLAFPTILILHAIGMGFLAGTSGILSLRVLGVAQKVPAAELSKYYPVMWGAFWLNLFSGVLLLMGYPTKALTNPMFYLKLVLIAVAVAATRRISQSLTGPDGPSVSRAVAWMTIVCWIGAITAGRLLAYTYRHLMSGE